MGAMRITRQAISPMPELLSYWLPLEDARSLIRYLNDTIAAMLGEAPERFVGLGAVPLQDVDAAIRELEYCRKLGFAGVEIASHVNGISIGDARFEPFFAAAEAMGGGVQVRRDVQRGGDLLAAGPVEGEALDPFDAGARVAGESRRVHREVLREVENLHASPLG